MIPTSESSPSREVHVTVADPYLSYPGSCSFYDDGPETQEMLTINRSIRPEHEQVETFLDRFDAFSPNKEKETAYLTIYEEISLLSNQLREIQRRITAWKFRHNSLSSFFRLPDELVLEVWKYVVHNADAFTTSGAPLAAIPGIVGVSRVCAYWRRLALKSPVLWTWLRISRPRSIEHLLDLSRGLDLTLILDTSGPIDSFTHMVKTSDNFLSVLREAFTRSKAVVFQNLYSDIPVLSLLLQFMPSACLNQFTHVEATGPQYLVLNHEQSIVFHQFIRNLPRLQTLILNDHTMFSPPNQSPHPAKAVMPRSVTNLEVRFGASAHSQPSSIRHVVEALSQLPRLRRLALSNIFSPLSKEDDSYCKKLPRIKLPSLSKICILAGAATCNRFLGTINASAAPIKSIELNGLWDEPDFSHKLALHGIFVKCTYEIPRIELLNFEEEVDHTCLVELLSSNEESFVVLQNIAIKHVLFLLSHLKPKHTRRLRHVHKIYYFINHSRLDVWQSLNDCNFPRLADIVFDPFLHPSFFRVFAQLRGSSDTVFDPWKKDLVQLGRPELQSRAEKPLYFANVDFCFAHADTGLRREHVSQPILEDIARITDARECYTLFLTEYARNNPDQGSHLRGETDRGTESLPEMAGNSSTSLIDTTGETVIESDI